MTLREKVELSLHIRDFMVTVLPQSRNDDEVCSKFLELLSKYFQFYLTYYPKIVEYIAKAFELQSSVERFKSYRNYQRLADLLLKRKFFTKSHKERLIQLLGEAMSDETIKIIQASNQVEEARDRDQVLQVLQDCVGQNYMKVLQKLAEEYYEGSDDHRLQVKQLAGMCLEKGLRLQPLLRIKELSEDSSVHFEQIMEQMVAAKDVRQLRPSGLLRQFLGFLRERRSRLNFKFVGVCQFGSIVNGFGSSSSDIDLSILTDNFINEEECLRRIKSELENEFGDKLKFEEIYHSRVNVLKVLQKDSQESLDVVINNVPGILNSALLRCYAQLDPKVRLLGVFIKEWAKSHGLVSSSLFSSYALILLMINFLISERLVPVLKREQRSKNAILVKKNRLGEGERVDPEFLADLAAARQECREFNLFKTFLGFLKHIHKLYKGKERVSIHCAGSCKQDYALNYIISIEDPFDKTYDPGRVKRHPDAVNRFVRAVEDSIEALERRDANRSTIEQMHRRPGVQD